MLWGTIFRDGCWHPHSPSVSAWNGENCCGVIGAEVAPSLPGLAYCGHIATGSWEVSVCTLIIKPVPQLPICTNTVGHPHGSLLEADCDTLVRLLEQPPWPSPFQPILVKALWETKLKAREGHSKIT